jgi:hypothetical protein
MVIGAEMGYTCRHGAIKKWGFANAWANGN